MCVCVLSVGYLLLWRQHVPFLHLWTSTSSSSLSHCLRLQTSHLTPHTHTSGHSNPFLSKLHSHSEYPGGDHFKNSLSLSLNIMLDKLSFPLSVLMETAEWCHILLTMLRKHSRSVFNQYSNTHLKEGPVHTSKQCLQTQARNLFGEGLTACVCRQTNKYTTLCVWPVG